MNPTRKLSADALFFFTHAGYSHDPKTESAAKGRTRCAEALAEAESIYLQACKVSDVGIDWNDDPDGFEDLRADKRAGRMDGQKAPESIEIALIWHRTESGSVHWLSSLGGIWDADANYRRVIRAELASDCIDQLRELGAQTITS